MRGETFAYAAESFRSASNTYGKYVTEAAEGMLDADFSFGGFGTAADMRPSLGFAAAAPRRKKLTDVAPRMPVLPVQSVPTPKGKGPTDWGAFIPFMMVTHLVPSKQVDKISRMQGGILVTGREAI